MVFISAHWYTKAYHHLVVVVGISVFGLINKTSQAHVEKRTPTLKMWLLFNKKSIIMYENTRNNLPNQLSLITEGLSSEIQQSNNCLSLHTHAMDSRGTVG